MKTVFLCAVIFCAVFKPIASKNYTRCELAKELYVVHNIPLNQLPVWVCIAGNTSNYKTGQSHPLIGYGIFGISGKFWCSRNEEQKQCRVKCSDLLDGDITDDVACAKYIYARHKIIQGDGFLAWDAYKSICRDNPKIEQFIEGCNLNLKGNYKNY